MKLREFHIGDILSITTGRLVSPRHVEGIYDILAYMAGEDVWTHQIPRISEEAKPVLLRQHPQLESVDASGVDKENFENWLSEQVVTFGETLPVRPMADGEHDSQRAPSA